MGVRSQRLALVLSFWGVESSLSLGVLQVSPRISAEFHDTRVSDNKAKPVEHNKAKLLSRTSLSLRKELKKLLSLKTSIVGTLAIHFYFLKIEVKLLTLPRQIVRTKNNSEKVFAFTLRSCFFFILGCFNCLAWLPSRILDKNVKRSYIYFVLPSSGAPWRDMQQHGHRMRPKCSTCIVDTFM